MFHVKHCFSLPQNAQSCKTTARGDSDNEVIKFDNITSRWPEQGQEGKTQDIGI
jgi:hypothetical protein